MKCSHNLAEGLTVFAERLYLIFLSVKYLCCSGSLGLSNLDHMCNGVEPCPWKPRGCFYTHVTVNGEHASLHGSFCVFCMQRLAGRRQDAVCAACPFTGLYMPPPTEDCVLIKCASPNRNSQLNISELPQKALCPCLLFNFKCAELFSFLLLNQLKVLSGPGMK